MWAEARVKQEPAGEVGARGEPAEQRVNQVHVKEPEFRVEVSCVKMEPWSELYADHVVKDELVLGPERPHRPDVGLVVRVHGKEPEFRVEVSYVKMEAWSELYSERQVKEELVLGPERPHRSTVGLVLRDWALGDADGCPLAWGARGGPQPSLRDCSVRLHRLPGTTHQGDTPTTADTQPFTFPLDYEACNICGKKFALKSDLMNHVMNHVHLSTEPEEYETYSNTIISDRKHVCEICGERFILKSELVRHVVIHIHTPEDPEASHDGVDSEPSNFLTFERGAPTNLEVARAPASAEHQTRPPRITNTHTLQATCGYLSKRKRIRHVKDHMQLNSETLRNKPKPYTCETAKNKITQSSSLKTHRQAHTHRHTGEKTSSCQICDKKFMHPCNLIRHKLIHTGEKPYSCKICKKKFTQSGDLKRHMLTHTGEKPFSCEECKNKFTQLSNLERHIRVHTGEKPYSCEVCKKKFSQARTLKNHQRTHTGDKRHSC